MAEGSGGSTLIIYSQTRVTENTEVLVIISIAQQISLETAMAEYGMSKHWLRTSATAFEETT